jgi:hypothetical protein
MPMSKVEGWKVRIFEIVLMTERRFASGSFETEGLMGFPSRALRT